MNATPSGNTRTNEQHEERCEREASTTRWHNKQQQKKRRRNTCRNTKTQCKRAWAHLPLESAPLLQCGSCLSISHPPRCPLHPLLNGTAQHGLQAARPKPVRARALLAVLLLLRNEPAPSLESGATVTHSSSTTCDTRVGETEASRHGMPECPVAWGTAT
mgnify:CR=1 FL=1